MDSEERIQGEFFQWVWNSQIIPRGCMWAVPNGGFRDRRTANVLKATGVVSGVWDLHIFYKGKFYILETKTQNGRLSKEQENWLKLMQENGVAGHFIYRTLEEGKTIIKKITENGNI